MKNEIKIFIERNINLIEEENYDELFDIAQQTYFYSTVSELGKVLESAGIFPIPKMTFIPEGYYLISYMSEYDIPDNIVKLCDSCFRASDLEYIHIKSNVERIEGAVFCDCDFLKTVNIDEGVSYIGNDVFYACDSLETLVIPKSVRFIGSNIISGCSNLKIIKYKGSRLSWYSIPHNELLTYDDCPLSHIICSDGIIDIKGD